MSQSPSQQIRMRLSELQDTAVQPQQIREIAKSVFSQVDSGLEAGSPEVRSAIQEAVATITELSAGQEELYQASVSALLEGTIEGLQQSRQHRISTVRAEIQRLQTQLDTEEIQLQADVDTVLNEAQSGQSDSLQRAVEAVAERLKDSEEVALMRKRYAQLKTQLSVLQANLVERYGDRYEEVKQHLEEAQTWYERSDPSHMFPKEVGQRQRAFEENLKRAATAVTQKEKQVQRYLTQLWETLTA